MGLISTLNYTPRVTWLACCGFNTYSQFGEDGLIEACLKKIGVTNRHCFECGAADGRFFSNTLRLREMGWYAVLIEKDPVSFGKLVDEFGTESSCLNEHVTDMDAVLRQTAIDERPDVGIIDVDGQDWNLWDRMTVYRPRVLVIETFAADRDPDAPVPALDDEIGQAGINPICELGDHKGYELVATTYVNAIFIDREALK